MFMLRLSAGALSVRWRAVCPARSAAAGAEQQEGCCNRDRSLGAARGSIGRAFEQDGLQVPLTATPLLMGRG